MRKYVRWGVGRAARCSLSPLLAIAAFLPLAAAEEIDPFPGVLQRIIRASRENFRPVEGARIDLYPGRRSYFQARISLPGTTECRIDEAPVLTYSCQWKPDPKAIAPGAPCSGLIQQVVAALDSDWQRKEPRTATSAAIFKNTGRYKDTEIAVMRSKGPSPVCIISIVANRPADQD